MVAKNFKLLSRYYRDKQEVLAQILCVSQSTISEYMNGKKHIPLDVLSKIAVRYNVSTDDLLTKDLSLEYDVPQTINLRDAMDFGNKMFPILTSNIAKTNEDFICAQKIFLTFLGIDRPETLYERIGDVEHAIALFQKAWEETNTYVALSNSLSVILLTYAFYNQHALKLGRELISKGRLNSMEMRYSLLRDPKKPLEDNKYDEQRKAFFEKYDDLAYTNIRHLKCNAQFSELGDYYLALCYLLGFAEEFIASDVCYQTGMYMLLQLCKLENKYAEGFMESLSAIS